MQLPSLDRKGSSHTPLLPTNVIPSITALTSDGSEEDRSTRPVRHIRTTSSHARNVADEYSYMTPSEAAARLRTSLTKGLSPTDALNRLTDYGPNEIPHDPPEPIWLRFAKQFQEPLIILLLVSAGASLLLGNKDDAVSITVAVTIVVSVGFVQEYRSEKSIEALNHLVPNFAHLVRSQGSKVLSLPTGQNWPAGEVDSRTDSSKPANSTKDSMGSSSSKVMASQLVPGDLVLFTTGDRVPADIRVTKASDLTVDVSNLTGETEPIKIQAAAKSRRHFTQSFSHFKPPSPSSLSPTPDDDNGGGHEDASNVVYMGTLVTSGHGQGIVFATGGHTQFGTIATSVSGTESPRSPLQLSMDELGTQLSKFSFLVIGLISVVGWLQGKNLLDIFTISISLAVAAIPEGLPIIVTVTLALGVHRMARHHAIVRRMPKVETLGSVNVVCTDKTGTLTTNHMTVVKWWHFGKKSPVDLETEVDPENTELKGAPQRILRIGNVANNARLSEKYTETGAAASAVLSSTAQNDGSVRTRWAGQPTDVAMLDLVDRFQEHDARESVGHRVSEVPFSSSRKFMGVTVASDSNEEKEYAYMKGSVEKVLAACDTYIDGEGREMILDSNGKKEAVQAADAMAMEGLRVLAFASGPVSQPTKGRHSASSTRVGTPASESPKSPLPQGSDDNYKHLAFAGLVAMSDPLKPGVERAVRRLMRGGVRVIMISGDAESTAVAIGKQLGMNVGSHGHYGGEHGPRTVLCGDDVDGMSEEQLAQAMQHTVIFARTNPDHKMKIIGALQSRGDIVAMTGDGVNDAPALKKADIGISMGRHGTDVAKEAADMILTDDNFSTILRAVEEGKGIFYNIQNFLTFQLSTSAASLSLVFLCTLFGYKNPLNAMQILWIRDIIMDGPPAQSLGVERVDPDVMTRPPRRRDDKVLTKSVLMRVAQQATVIMVGTILVYRREMLADGMVTRRDTTMTFTCFVFFDMFNALSCRSESKSILRGEVGFFSNNLFNWAVSLSILCQLLVIYFPWLQEIFQTEALYLSDLFWLLVLCSSVFWADEVRKYVKYGKRRLVSGYSQAV